MRLIFLIDYENVHINGLEGIELTSPEDKIMVFYSSINKQTKESIKAKATRKNISFINTISNGKNALDFQLISFLSFDVGKRYKDNSLVEKTPRGSSRGQSPLESNQSACYYIISKDKGYDCTSLFWSKPRDDSPWSELNLNKPVPKFYIKRAASIHQAFYNCNPDKIELLKIQKEINDIIKSIDNRTDFHTALIDKFGKEQGRELYHANKDRVKKDTSNNLAKIQKIINSVNKNKSKNNKSVFYAELIKRLGQEKGREIYLAHREKIITDKNG